MVRSAGCNPVDPSRTNLGTMGTAIMAIGREIETAADMPDDEVPDIVLYQFVLAQLLTLDECVNRNGPTITAMLIEALEAQTKDTPT